jgi:hypothetical protein
MMAGIVCPRMDAPTGYSTRDLKEDSRSTEMRRGITIPINR